MALPEVVQSPDLVSKSMLTASNCFSVLFMFGNGFHDYFLCLFGFGWLVCLFLFCFVFSSRTEVKLTDLQFPRFSFLPFLK